MRGKEMRTVDVCLSPELIHLYPIHDRVVIVVDIFRATSCMVTALASGVEQIEAFATLEECLAMREKGYLTAGERDGKKVDGFDFGNSPFEYMHEELVGKRIAFTTTNGTQAIVKARGARKILIGSFLNLSAITNHLLAQASSVLIVCAGWKGKVNMEDTLFAGAVVSRIHTAIVPACDAPLMAQQLYQQASADMEKYLQPSSHLQRLLRLGIKEDIAFCLTNDKYDVVPEVNEGVIKLMI